ncbi:hypothetical protein A7K94_0218595, partial [Modestobacter sp. VKM Ac-2676]
MLDGVGQRLLHDPVRAQPQLGRYGRLVDLRGDRHALGAGGLDELGEPGEPGLRRPVGLVVRRREHPQQLLQLGQRLPG